MSQTTPQQHKFLIASDHAGYRLKEVLIAHLKKHDIAVSDLGTDNDESVDYTDYAHPLCDGIANGEAEYGILICGSGIGMSMVANRHPHIRAALCYNAEIAKLARQHNDANILVLGERFTEQTEACKILDNFLQTCFERGRHERRIAKLNQ